MNRGLGLRTQQDLRFGVGDTDLCPWDMGTFGSRTIRYFGPALREAAAEAKAILIDLASDHLKIPDMSSSSAGS